MKCPVCNVELLLADRQGIEIDYCPQCRGIWLDRGELDKLIERSQPTPQHGEYRQTYTQPPRGYPEHSERHDQQDHYRQHGHPDHHGRKRKSMLEEIFDFD